MRQKIRKVIEEMFIKRTYGIEGNTADHATDAIMEIMEEKYGENREDRLKRMIKEAKL